MIALGAFTQASTSARSPFGGSKPVFFEWSDLLAWSWSLPSEERQKTLLLSGKNTTGGLDLTRIFCLGPLLSFLLV